MNANPSVQVAEAGTQLLYTYSLHTVLTSPPISVKNTLVRSYSQIDWARNPCSRSLQTHPHVDRVKRIWYLSPMRAAKVQTSLRIRAVSPEPSLLAHTSSESREIFRQTARSLAPLNGWACAVKICHDGMLDDTNSLDAAHV